MLVVAPPAVVPRGVFFGNGRVSTYMTVQVTSPETSSQGETGSTHPARKTRPSDEHRPPASKSTMQGNLNSKSSHMDTPIRRNRSQVLRRC